MVYNHFVEKIIFNEHNNIKIKNKVRLGVSICLDVISTPKKVSLNSRDFLDSLKNDISTVEIFSTVQKPSLDSLDYSKNQDFSIFVEISIETHDLDVEKVSVSTWWIISTL